MPPSFQITALLRQDVPVGPFSLDNLALSEVNHHGKFLVAKLQLPDSTDETRQTVICNLKTGEEARGNVGIITASNKAARNGRCLDITWRCAHGPETKQANRAKAAAGPDLGYSDATAAPDSAPQGINADGNAAGTPGAQHQAPAPRMPARPAAKPRSHPLDAYADIEVDDYEEERATEEQADAQQHIDAAHACSSSQDAPDTAHKRAEPEAHNATPAMPAAGSEAAPPHAPQRLGKDKRTKRADRGQQSKGKPQMRRGAIRHGESAKRNCCYKLQLLQWEDQRDVLIVQVTAPAHADAEGQNVHQPCSRFLSTACRDAAYDMITQEMDNASILKRAPTLQL